MMIHSIAVLLTVLLGIRIASEIVVRLFIRRRFVWPKNVGNGASWAVVTGAGSGMGFEWARQLALKGYSLLMIGLVEEELAQAKVMIAREVKLQTTHDITIQTMTVDFNAVTEDEKMYERIEAALDLPRREVFVLVNNAGTNAGLPDDFLSGDYVKRNRTLINVNIVPMTRLTEMVLPSMVKRNRGLIINMASGSCFMPVSLLTAYAATKSYVWKFSECLAAEYRDSNVNIVAFGPLVVSTPMTNNPRTQAFVLSARDYVEKALASIRYHQFSWSHVYWGHWVHNAVVQSIGWLFTPMALERFHIWSMPRMKRTADSMLSDGRHFNWWQQIKFLFFDDHKKCSL